MGKTGQTNKNNKMIGLIIMVKIEPAIATSSIINMLDYVEELNKLYKNYNEADDVTVKNEIIHTIRTINKELDKFNNPLNIDKGGNIYAKPKN